MLNKWAIPGCQGRWGAEASLWVQWCALLASEMWEWRWGLCPPGSSRGDLRLWPFCFGASQEVLNMNWMLQCTFTLEEKRCE